MSIHQVTWNAQQCGILRFNKLSCFECKRECAYYFLSEKKYSEADNDALNLDDVEALLSYVSNCTPCHSDEYSSCFFSCRPRYWNKSGFMFLKSHCDIKQFHHNIKQFHRSIKEMENTTMEFHSSIQKTRSAPMGCFLWDLHLSYTYLQVYLMIRRKKHLFNDVPNFKIRKLNFQVIQRFIRIPCWKSLILIARFD